MVEIQRYRVIKFQDIIVVKYTFHLWECLIISKLLWVGGWMCQPGYFKFWWNLLTFSFIDILNVCAGTYLKSYNLHCRFGFLVYLIKIKPLLEFWCIYGKWDVYLYIYSCVILINNCLISFILNSVLFYN